MSNPALEIQNICKSYGKRKVVDNLSICVNRGEVYGFLGPNGAGKSTTIRIILSLTKADSGVVKIFGQSVSEYKEKTLVHTGAMIEKADFYLNLTAEQNLKMLASMTKTPSKRIDEVLDIVGLESRRLDKVKKYSQGMKQRLGIAQSLLNYPKLLVLDEPTNGLDPAGMKEIRDLILKLSNEGITIFISSHLLSEVEKICTSMVIIKNGVAIREGNVKDLISEISDIYFTISVNQVKKAQTIIGNLSFAKLVNTDGEYVQIISEKDRISDIINIFVDEGIQIKSVIPNMTLEDYFLTITDENSKETNSTS
ncbi:MAG: ABC transporter ATP-binding protein [Bacteroidetes bacterium]|jgi:ABC-type multidrug transport system ATPase subunit|nr:ABC transporter ATP-binding protein [Bacteroidota bacterium]